MRYYVHVRYRVQEHGAPFGNVYHELQNLNQFVLPSGSLFQIWSNPLKAFLRYCIYKIGTDGQITRKRPHRGIISPEIKSHKWSINIFVDKIDYYCAALVIWCWYFCGDCCWKCFDKFFSRGSRRDEERVLSSSVSAALHLMLHLWLCGRWFETMVCCLKREALPLCWWGKLLVG